MNKKAYMGKFDKDLFEKFEVEVNASGFLKINEALELLMEAVITQKIKIKKEKKTNISYIKTIEF